LKVNGKIHTLTVEPRVTLLDALRVNLDYTGAKKVCDRAVCGTCTVIMGGKAVYACALLAVDAQGKDIVTIEGLSTPGKLHPIQQAFIEHDATQCGFCTSGFVVACKAFLDKNPNPTMEQIEEGLAGNLCRCGTYTGIRQAVLTAAKTMKGGQSNA
jgi:aerobic-type carbon monoxide dehydrogenase small subunit (CoxS/CutS family)